MDILYSLQSVSICGHGDGMRNDVTLFSIKIIISFAFYQAKQGKNACVLEAWT